MERESRVCVFDREMIAWCVGPAQADEQALYGNSGIPLDDSSTHTIRCLYNLVIHFLPPYSSQLSSHSLRTGDCSNNKNQNPKCKMDEVEKRKAKRRDKRKPMLAANDKFVRCSKVRTADHVVWIRAGRTMPRDAKRIVAYCALCRGSIFNYFEAKNVVSWSVDCCATNYTHERTPNDIHTTENALYACRSRVAVLDETHGPRRESRNLNCERRRSSIFIREHFQRWVHHACCKYCCVAIQIKFRYFECDGGAG